MLRLRGLAIVALTLLAGCVSVPGTRYYDGEGDYYYGSGAASVVIDSYGGYGHSYGYGGGWGYGGYGGYGPGYGGGYYSPWYGGGWGLGYSPWRYPSHANESQRPRRGDPGLRGRHGERLQAAPQRQDSSRPGMGFDRRQGERAASDRYAPRARPEALRAPTQRLSRPETSVRPDYRGGSAGGNYPSRPQRGSNAGMRNTPRPAATPRPAPQRATSPPVRSTRVD